MDLQFKYRKFHIYGRSLVAGTDPTQIIKPTAQAQATKFGEQVHSACKGGRISLILKHTERAAHNSFVLRR